MALTLGLTASRTAQALPPDLGDDEALDHCTLAPNECVREMTLGEPAPFAGQLLITPLAVKLGNLAYDCPTLIAAEVARARGDDAADATRAAAVAHADSAALTEQLQGANEALARAEAALKRAQPAWYQQPWFVAPVAAVLSAGVVAFALR